VKSFAWSGPTVQRLTLGSRSTHVIQQRACFLDAGVYDLGGVLRVMAGQCVHNDDDDDDDGTEMFSQRAVSAAPIVIHRADTSPLLV